MFTVLITSVILGIGLGISAILARQIKILREVGNSVVALYAADSGVEQVLYQDSKACRSPNCSTTAPLPYCTSNCSGLKTGFSTTTILANDAVCNVSFSTTSEGDSIIKSIGIYKNTRRGLEVTR